MLFKERERERKPFRWFLRACMILPIVLFFLASPLPAQSPPPTVPTYYVDVNYQGSDPDWFNNIQDAVDAGNLSQVIVYPGIYHENVVIQGYAGDPKEVHLVSPQVYRHAVQQEIPVADAEFAEPERLKRRDVDLPLVAPRHARGGLPGRPGGVRPVRHLPRRAGGAAPGGGRNRGTA